MDTKYNELLYRINKSLHLTDDVLKNTSIITVLGDKGVCIENYNKIKVFLDEITVIETVHEDVEIKGNKLHLESCYADEILIRGKIDGVSFNKGSVRK